MTLPLWRYIPPLSAPGSVQMALDHWLFEQHSRQLHPPTLRFYTWQPAAISLGYHQKRFPEHWSQLTWGDQPLELVRRPSGGRAVLHQGDLTYAVVTTAATDHRMEGYRQICRFLIEGWRSLQFPLHFGDAGRGYIHNPNCFGTATAADLVLDNGTKLIGSAQLRRQRTVLQHGSIRLNPDPELFAQVFGEPLPMTTFPAVVASDRVIAALRDAAEQCFGMRLETRSLSPEEWIAVESGLDLPPVGES